MNEHTKIRLGIIAARFGKRSDAPVGSAQAWLAEYEALRTGVLRTAMSEIGSVLEGDGHRCEVVLDVDPAARTIDLVVTPWGDVEKERRIRFFARTDPHRGFQVVAHIWLFQSPSELTRFERPSEVTAEVAEQLLVDAIEQIFASAASRARREEAHS